MKITDIIELLHKADYYGNYKHIEIAKGKHEYISTWIGFKRKIKRLWLYRK